MLTNDTDVKDEAGLDTSADAPSAEGTKAETVESAVFEAMKDEFLPTAEEEPVKTDEEEVTEEATDESEEEPAAEAEADADEPDIDDSDLKEKTQKRVRNLLSEKRELEAKVLALEAERNQPHTQDEYVEAGYDETAAELRALKDELRVERESRQIAQLNSDMIQGGAEAEKNYPVYDEASPDYDKVFVEQVGNAYRRQANIQLDPNNEYVVRADIPLYDFYKQAAEWRAHGQELGRQAGAKDSAKQYASAEQPPTNRPTTTSSEKTEPVDLLLQGLTRNLGI